MYRLPRNTGGTSLLPVFLLLVVLVAGILAFIYKDEIMTFVNKQLNPEKKSARETVVITSEGSGYETETKTEEYTIMPLNLPESVSIYPAFAYNPNDTDVDGGPMTFNKDDVTCPDGTYDCLYYERVENGKVTKITNKEGVDFIELFTNDLYSGKLSLITGDMINEKKTRFMMNEKAELLGIRDNGTFAKMKPGIDFPFPTYILVFLIMYKDTFKDKPKPKIRLNYDARTLDELKETVPL